MLYIAQYIYSIDVIFKIHEFLQKFESIVIEKNIHVVFCIINIE